MTPQVIQAISLCVSISVGAGLAALVGIKHYRGRNMTAGDISILTISFVLIGLPIVRQFSMSPKGVQVTTLEMTQLHVSSTGEMLSAHQGNTGRMSDVVVNNNSRLSDEDIDPLLIRTSEELNSLGISVRISLKSQLKTVSRDYIEVRLFDNYDRKNEIAYSTWEDAQLVDRIAVIAAQKKGKSLTSLLREELPSLLLESKERRDE